jgi:hypothetical protein
MLRIASRTAIATSQHFFVVYQRFHDFLRSEFDQLTQAGHGILFGLNAV